MFEIFWGVRNALVSGLFWMIGLYLCFGNLVPWALAPMAGSSTALTKVVSGLGVPGMTAVALMLMALAGGVIVRTTAALWLAAHRRILMYVLRNVDSTESAKRALNQLRPLGSFFRSYTNRALTRLIEEFLRQRGSITALPSEIRTLASNVVFMGMALLDVSEARFAEQQKTNAHWELATSLILGLPLAISAVTANLTTDFLSGIPGYALALVSAGFTFYDAHRAWRDRNSQIAHGLVDKKSDLSGITQNWDVSGGLKHNIAISLAKRLTRDHGPAADLAGPATASATATATGGSELADALPMSTDTASTEPAESEASTDPSATNS